MSQAPDTDPEQDRRPETAPQLIRGMGLGEATSLNMLDMIGVGPFITMPLIIGAMGGPQAMLGWMLGAGFAVCDGLVWAELGAAMPGSGGSYRYLREIYGPKSLGKLISFLLSGSCRSARRYRLRRDALGWQVMPAICGRRWNACISRARGTSPFLWSGTCKSAGLPRRVRWWQWERAWWRCCCFTGGSQR